MENLNKLWRSFFATGLIAIAVQQIICHDFRPVMLPPGYPAWLLPRLVWTWVFSIALIAACAAILFGIKARPVSLLLAAVLLLMVLLFQISGQPYPAHLGVWEDALKELTFSGGAFIVAGSFPQENKASGITKLLEKLIPLGKYFLAVMMVASGIMHFVYPDFVATLVPNWIPGHYFWTYFAGIALIAGGLGIILNIRRQLAANLLGIMIFLWLIMLHIPRAIADPHSGNGNEWTSVFEALAFCGIAFLLASRPDKKIFN
jgi:uncharacterized membrane protein YphA (DoxX/SURF4 family)